MFQPEPRSIGPNSLLWRYAGDQRLGFVGLATGILQLMHPGIGAGVAQHSAFFTEPWDRIQRSMPLILGVIYNEDAENTGNSVREFHRGIKGKTEHGEAYSALRPETFWWAHATFQWAVFQLIDRFDNHRLTDAERESLYLDGIEWYRRYGMGMDPVPPTYAEFVDKWEYYCREVLELNVASSRSLDMALHEKVSDMPGLPGWSNPLQREVLTPLLRLTAIGGLPRTVRKRFDLPWGRHEELQMKGLELWVRQNWRFVPRHLRYAPTALAGKDRVRNERRSLAHAS
ncbi:MAG: oxygenase MpaB family protein [Microthrixaceae bacterium]|nr:DUF2236 domain-containing protein [Microthrixaceae bacterium]MCO5313187.1 oxygenase MpaB family protein [Microthrixaceae bacterium]